MGQAQDIGDVCGPDVGFNAGGQLDISAKLVEGVGAISTKLDEVLKERTVTRQASKISENELDVVMESLRCKRAWLNADPDLTELLGAPPEEGGVWYVFRFTVADMPLQVSDK